MLLFHATNNTVRVPRWLEDWSARENVLLTINDRTDGVLWCLHGKYESVPTDLIDYEWGQIAGEPWEVAQVGKWYPWWLARENPNHKLIPVADSNEQVWNIISIMLPFPTFQPRLCIPCGKDWAPKPDTWQESLINIANWVRAEIMKGLDPDSQTYDIGANRPMNEELYMIAFDRTLVMEAAAEILCTTYHMHTPLVQELGILDDFFAGRIIRDASGFEPSSQAKVAAALGL